VSEQTCRYPKDETEWVFHLVNDVHGEGERWTREEAMEFAVLMHSAAPETL
jgi:hypothetical protein